MTNVRVARRYAAALVELAVEEKNVDILSKDLQALRGAIRESKELLLFLRSPVINHARKNEILKAVFAGRLHQSTLRALEVVTLKGREDVLADIVDQFFALLDEREGIVRVEVRAAMEFTKDQAETLRKKLEQYTQKQVKIEFKLDHCLIGGFVARVGDTVLDGSVKRQLELLRVRFAQGNGTN
jgi:F-type H+-transporting ATPase subunit delta